jgi:hypothetical protein
VAVYGPVVAIPCALQNVGLDVVDGARIGIEVP